MRIFNREFTEAEVLQVSAIVVAAPRYMGAFASAVGVSIVTHWPAFVTIEILSGLAMAVLEGWALAFTFKRWRRVTRYTFDWYVLGAILAILLLALPATATPYLVSSQLGLPVSKIIPVLPTFLLWLWSFLIAAIAPLVVAAVGYADDGAVTMTTAPAKVDKPMAKPVTPAAKPVAQEPVTMTTGQRRQVVTKLTNDGIGADAIARRLNVSPRTVYRDIEVANGNIKR